MKQNDLSKGEFQSVCQADGGLDHMIDPKCKNKDLLVLIKYISPEDKFQKVMANQAILRHKPQTIGINLDQHGWANVGELIDGVNHAGL